MSLELLCFESFLDYSLNRFAHSVWKSTIKSRDKILLLTFSAVCLLSQLFVYIYQLFVYFVSADFQVDNQ